MNDMMYIPQGLPTMKGLTSQSQENTATEPLDHALNVASKITHSLVGIVLGIGEMCGLIPQI